MPDSKSRYIIEKNIEIPERGQAKTWLNRFPWSRMEVGDSFLVDDRGQITLNRSVAEKNKRGPGRFIVRTVEGGTRVWRVE